MYPSGASILYVFPGLLLTYQVVIRRRIMFKLCELRNAYHQGSLVTLLLVITPLRSAGSCCKLVCRFCVETFRVIGEFKDPTTIKTLLEIVKQRTNIIKLSIRVLGCYFSTFLIILARFFGNWHKR